MSMMGFQKTVWIGEWSGCSEQYKVFVGFFFKLCKKNLNPSLYD